MPCGPAAYCGWAGGKRAYVQLKHGASYLRHRQRDDKMVFRVKNERHIGYWQSQPCDVYLVVRTPDEIRTGEGEIRWMNVTRYLKARRDKRSRQIVFEGERLDAAALRRVRDKAVRGSRKRRANADGGAEATDR